MRKNILTALGFALVLLAGGPSQAANMGFMADQAMSRFTDQDAELFNQAAGKALMGKEGTEIKWSNPATGAFGTLTPYPDPEKMRIAASFTWSILPKTLKAPATTDSAKAPTATGHP